MNYQEKYGSLTDIHLSLDDLTRTVLFPGKIAPTQQDIPFLTEVANQIRQANKGDESQSFMIKAGPLRYRVQALRKGIRYACRKAWDRLPVYNKDVAVPDGISRDLFGEDLRRTGGLVVINGANGSGKTTFAYATLTKRIELLGGYGLLIEDPPEIESEIIEGHYGAKGGFIEQMDASTGGYGKAIYEALRCFPAGERSILLIGEVRDGDTAAEMLRIAMAGHTVFTTTHAKDHIAAFQRIVTLARDAGEVDASAMLSASLRMSIHLRMDDNARYQISGLNIDNSIRQNIDQQEWVRLKAVINQKQLPFSK